MRVKDRLSSVRSSDENSTFMFYERRGGDEKVTLRNVESFLLFYYTNSVLTEWAVVRTIP